jgi:hypothetical protein
MIKVFIIVIVIQTALFSECYETMTDLTGLWHQLTSYLLTSSASQLLSKVILGTTMNLWTRSEGKVQSSRNSHIVNDSHPIGSSQNSEVIYRISLWFPHLQWMHTDFIFQNTLFFIQQVFKQDLTCPWTS